MQVVAASGATVARLDEDELRSMVEAAKSIRHLKKLLSEQVGCSRFRQRLLCDKVGELQDDMPLCLLPTVQLVILNFCAPDEILTQQLLDACENNRVGEVENLLQKPQDPNVRCANTGNVPLQVAARNGHLEVVRLLLEAGVDKDAGNGATALISAAGNGHLEVVQLLLEAGADKDAAMTDGATCLHYAAGYGHSHVVRLLLEAKVDKDATADGGTALQFACEEGHLGVVRLLLGDWS